MKTFKRTDLLISSSLLVICFIIVLFNSSMLNSACLVIGGWQLTSMLVHITKGWFMKKGGARFVYHYVILVILIVIILSRFVPLLSPVYFILWFGSPVLALIYTRICYDELSLLTMNSSLMLK